MNRTVGIGLTIFTVLCCACPGLALCVSGGMIGAGVPLTTSLNDVSTVQDSPCVVRFRIDLSVDHPDPDPDRGGFLHPAEQETCRG